MLAIMGATGAGKSTLMNVMTSRNLGDLKVSGELMVNGKSIKRSELAGISAYIQQENFFIGSLTVKEHLRFQAGNMKIYALLRMGKEVSHQQRMKRVEDIIIEMGLSNCSGTIIGIPGRIKGISGGELKRLSIASEILMDPPLLFFDEPTSGLDSFLAQQMVALMKSLAEKGKTIPTSGLDSFLAQQMVALMKSLAEKGKTIVSIIHQPSSEIFPMFDRILLLAEGRTAFTGLSKDAASFFQRIGYECPSKYNPADFYIHTLAIVPGAEEERKERVSFICDAFWDSEERKALEDEIGLSGEAVMNGAPKDNSDIDEKENEMTFKYELSWFSQFRAIFARCCTANLREPFIIKLRFFQTVMLALLLGVIFWRQDYSKYEGVMNVNGAIFILLISGNTMNIFSLLNLFCEELPVFLREHQSGMYRTDAYFISKVVAELPLSILFPAVFTAIVYFMIGLNGSLDRFVVCALIMIIMSNVVTSCSYMISCLTSSVSTGLTLATLILLPMLLVSGHFINNNSIPVYLLWLKYISWFYYGNEALMINQWKDLEIDCGDSFRCLPHGDAVLSVMHFDAEGALLSVVLLCPPFLGESTPRHFHSIHHDDMNGIACPGELLAIMGASGAGKTTLLNVMTSRNLGKLNVSGKLMVNGKTIKRSALAGMSAYVQQEDLFIGTLTVREHLRFQARKAEALLRMGKEIKHQQRMDRVEEVISDVKLFLGLSKCSDSIIGVPGRIQGISGGERKRLSIASEVLTDPPLLFCDEPTSGLDSFMAQQVVALMKSLAEKGKTVISTIHQPSSEVYSMFDRILFMAEGRAAFMGLADRAISFFQGVGYGCPPNYNPADFFIHTLAVVPGSEMECRKRVARICDAFRDSEEGRAMEKEVELCSDEASKASPTDMGDIKWKERRLEDAAGWFQQFRAVVARSWTATFREPLLIKFRLLQTVVKSSFGVISHPQCTQVFCEELPIFVRERQSGLYRTDAYFLGKTLAELPFFVVFPAAFAAIAYHMIGLNPVGERFIVCVVVMVAVANVACSFGYMVSCIAPNVDVALALSPPLVIPLLMFGGLLINNVSVPVYFLWLKYISWYYYGNEILMVNQWKGVEGIECGESFLCQPDGDSIIAMLNFEKPGEMLVIMGASGAGKTTLMNVMTSRNLGDLKVSGKLMVNGKSIKRSALAGISAYIQQENFFIGSLTVREHLRFQARKARLRMGKEISREQRLKRVEDIIIEMGLSNCSDTTIGIPGRIKGISGGELKRLSIASEILMDPPLLFFDEPTSGLDSFLAQQVVALMKSLAEKGKTVVSIVHQPSSEIFAMFDRILLLAEGRTAFTGMSNDAVSFFQRMGYECPSNYNPADFYIHTLAIVPGAEEERRERVSFICDAFGDSEERKALEGEIGLSGEAVMNANDLSDERGKEIAFEYELSWFAQFRTIFARSWTANLREPLVVKLRLFQMVVRNFQTFCEEFPVFLKEHQSGMYRVDAYFISKVAAELPFSILFLAIFTAIAYFMIGLNGSLDRFVVCTLIMIMISNYFFPITFGECEGLTRWIHFFLAGYMISCLTRNVSTAVTTVSLIFLPLLLFSGFFMSSNSVPVYLVWLKYISWFYYGNEALMINQWKDLEIDCGDSFRCLPHGDAVLSVLFFDMVRSTLLLSLEPANVEDNHLRDILMLLVLMKECRKRVARICDAFRVSEEGEVKMGKEVELCSDEASKASPTDMGDIKWKERRLEDAAGWFQQFPAVVARSWTASLREPLLIQLRLLQSVVLSGIVYPGEMLAIMGASGAGKSTLMNVMTSRNLGKLKVSGKLMVNGKAIKRSALAGISAYIQQENNFIGTLTVREHLRFQAVLRMGKDVKKQKRMERVEEVILDLGLSNCSDMMIGIPGRVKGISGGELKRLSIASEVCILLFRFRVNFYKDLPLTVLNFKQILLDPPLLFWDEPTSGLDSYMAGQVVALMKSLAEKGKTVVSIIHQPSSEIFAMFDRILLLTEGRAAFMGLAKLALPFFQRMGYECPLNFNPADFYVHTLAIAPGEEEEHRERVSRICDAFKESVERKVLEGEVGFSGEVDDDESPNDPDEKGSEMTFKYKVSWFAQFCAVFVRSWTVNRREPYVIKIRLFQSLMVALLLGVVYLRQDYHTVEGVMNINGAVFIFLIFASYQNALAMFNVFCEELPVFLREHQSGLYRTDVYFISKFIAEFPFSSIFPIIATSIAYFMIGLNESIDRFFYCILIMTIISNVSTSFGCMCSCMTKNINLAITIGTPMFIPFMLFGGFFLNNDSVPVYFLWLKYISWFYYGNEALMINQWKDLEIDCGDSVGCSPNGNAILEYFNFDKVPFIDSLC
ncbi:unnamed protein product, partial [Darwinula stevensoni]